MRVYGYIVNEETLHLYNEYLTDSNFSDIVEGNITGKATGKTFTWDSNWLVYNDTYSSTQRIYDRVKHTVIVVDGEEPYVTGVNPTDVSSKTVSSVRYYNSAGIASATPFEGFNIVVTKYSDGTISTLKRIIRQ